MTRSRSPPDPVTMRPASRQPARGSSMPARPSSTHPRALASEATTRFRHAVARTNVLSPYQDWERKQSGYRIEHTQFAFGRVPVAGGPVRCDEIGAKHCIPTRPPCSPTKTASPQVRPRTESLFEATGASLPRTKGWTRRPQPRRRRGIGCLDLAVAGIAPGGSRSCRSPLSNHAPTFPHRMKPAASRFAQDSRFRSLRSNRCQAPYFDADCDLRSPQSPPSPTA